MARPVLTDEQRARRRGELLAAARALFRESGELPPVARLAERAGIAKGSVYLSFATKEEVFVALLEESFLGLLGRVAPEIAALPLEPARAAGRFAQRYAQALAESPDLLRLAGMTHAVLEKNLPLPAMLAFKRTLAEGLQTAAVALQQRGVVDDRERGLTLLLHTWGLTLGLWQALDYVDALRPHLKQAPLAVFERDFLRELEAAVETLWRGALGR